MKLSTLSVKRPITMSMVILLIIIIGIVSLNGLAVDLFPELEFPIAAITVNYPGVGPEEMEQLVVTPLENIMGTISNVESINSSSRMGGALIIVQFTWGTDMNFATLQMRERIDMIRENLPSEVPMPTVLKFDPRVLPIVQLAISSSEYELTETKRIAENRIKPKLEPVEGVAAINVEGGREHEIRISFDQKMLQKYGLTLQQIQQLLLAENLNVPGGIIQERELDLPLRIVGQLETVQEIEQLPIPTNQGIVPLASIATLEETYKPENVVSFLNGESSVGISIQKQTDANTVTVSRDINRILEELRAELPGVTIEPIFDQALYINQSIRAVAINMLIGSILAGLVLYVFLRHFRSTMVVAFSIPLSIMGTFILMYFTDQTLNLLTLGGLALGIGMMVDNAIVIIENIYRYRQMGYSMTKSAIKGTSEVGPAVVAATLTTVIVFLPIVFVEGLAAQLFKPLALSVTYALLASLFVSLIIVPLLASRFISVQETESLFQLRFKRTQERYQHVLKWALKRPRKVAFLVLLVFLISFAGIPFIGTEFLPHQDQSMIYMDTRLPVGSSLERTVQTSEEIEERIQDIPEIKNIYVTVGGVGQFQLAAGTLTNRANYNVQLVPLSERSRSDTEIADEIREALATLPDVRVNVNTGDSGFSGQPITLQIRGQDIQVLESLGHEVVSIISTIDGVREPQSDFTAGQEEIRVLIDRHRAVQYGLTSAQIANFIREAADGLTATRLSRSGEEIDIRLTLGKERLTTQELSMLEIDTPMDQRIPLALIADFTEETSPHTIRRSDRIREVMVNAQLLDRDLGTVIKEIRETLEQELSLPAGYSIHFGGQNEQMLDAFKKLAAALALAVVLVYMIMAAQFESYFYPFIIMFAVPLTVIGVIFGLLVTFRPLNVGSMVGLLVLAGIVVNNAIVFVDYVNTLRKRGMERDEALYTAGPVRLRPILMTALTTVIGLIPLVLGFGEGSEIQAPMATVIIFGLSFATLITLIFVPVMYKIFDEWREKRRGLQKEKTG